MEAMAKDPSHSVEFKWRVRPEYLAGETLHGFEKHHDISPNLIRNAPISVVAGPVASPSGKDAI
jgi:hypothetical protein